MKGLSDKAPDEMRFLDAFDGADETTAFAEQHQNTSFTINEYWSIVRETKSDACGAAPYTFLGTADYVSHISSRPMNIVWRLHQEIPAKYLRKTQQVIGY